MIQMETYRLLLVLAMVSIIITGCSVGRFIPEGEKLYTGAEVHISTTSPDFKTSPLRAEMEQLIRPKPNKKQLLGRVGLWAHYKGTREKSSFITKFLNKKIGEEPVYLSMVQPAKTSELMENRLENKGHFYSEVSYHTIEKRKKAFVTYHAEVSQPYKLMSYQMLPDEPSLPIIDVIERSLASTVLTKGEKFDLALMQTERERISTYLRERGYYLFTPDYLIFRSDTNQYQSRHFDLYLSIKKDTPHEALKAYEIGEITVFTDYKIDADDNLSKLDSIRYSNMLFVQRQPDFNIKYLPDIILFRQGQLYDSRLHRATSSRLASIRNFRYVSVQFSPSDSLASGPAKLNSQIYLSPYNKRSLRAEAQATTKSNNFTGPGLLLTYRNRNLFGGGEMLEVNAKMAYETQLSKGQQTGLNTYEFSLRNSIIFPRVVAPIAIRSKHGQSMPSTRIGLSASSLNRMQFYRLGAFQASYGFLWWSSRYVSHEFLPVAINLMYTSKKSPEFREILEGNPFLARSFDNQFIPGIKYTFRYNGLLSQERPHRFYVEAGLDYAGNMLNAARRAVGTEVREKMFGLNYANYSRFDVDFRHYFQMAEESRLVSRLFVGVGLPHYGNNSLPYIKQYFSGGPNSLRAFPVRSVGPGTYTPDRNSTRAFFDQAGDIKVEANMEFRFPLVSYLKGAIFAETGNIWLANENPSLPGGQFTSQWHRQLAVGTGLGFRLDFEYLVLRLDLGIPIHDPSKPIDARWIDRLSPGAKDWRREFTTWNFAIGYPF